MNWQSIMYSEYGVTPDVAGARAWGRISRIAHVSEHAPPIESAGLYVGICRRLDPTLAGIDGRIIACGWNRYSPTEWLGRGRDQNERALPPIDAFVAYWNATQERPRIAGSEYNSYPEDVFALWRAGVSVRDARRIGSYARIAVIMINGKRHVQWKLVRRAIRQRRAERRACAIDFSHEEYERRLSPKAWAALGRVSVEMQEAILAEVRRRPPKSALPDGRARKLHASELPWEVGAEIHRQLLADSSGRLRIALARGKRQSEMLDEMLETKSLSWLCPSYPQVSLNQAMRLCRGESPVQLSEGVLTRQEARQWLSTTPQVSPTEYLTSQLPRCPVVRSIKVVRWLMSVHARGQWSSLTKEREIVGPGGRRIRVQLFDRVDEILDEDLDRGAATGVQRAFEHAAERVGTAWIERYERDFRTLASLPTHWHLYPCMRHLCTPAALVQEGKEMRHCVGTYVPAVERGDCVILAICVLGERSTVELSRGGIVRQHRGMQNGIPPSLNCRVLDRFLQRNRLCAKKAA